MGLQWLMWNQRKAMAIVVQLFLSEGIVINLLKIADVYGILHPAHVFQVIIRQEFAQMELKLLLENV